MIVLDASALVAIALREPEADDFITRIGTDGQTCLSTANYVEVSLVLEGRAGAVGRSSFEALINDLRSIGMNVVAFDETQAELAREGFRRYGKGRHPAGLNFGDCFAYALAKALDAPLLYKGGDFDQTNVKRL